MRRLLLIVLATALTLALSAAPASAHRWTYCGHSEVGFYRPILFRQHYTWGGRHWHLNWHRDGFGFGANSHYRWDYCPWAHR